MKAFECPLVKNKGDYIYLILVKIVCTSTSQDDLCITPQHTNAHLFGRKCSVIRFSCSLSLLLCVQPEHLRAERGGFYGDVKRSPSGSSL